MGLLHRAVAGAEVFGRDHSAAPTVAESHSVGGLLSLHVVALVVFLPEAPLAEAHGHPLALVFILGTVTAVNV